MNAVQRTIGGALMTVRLMAENVARLECYAEIRDCMRTRLLEYYQRHKEYLGDERSQAAIKESVDGLNCIFEVLDTYEIARKPQTSGADE
jgi:hypothetical protein